MARAHIFSINVKSQGTLIHSVEGTGRVNKLPALRATLTLLDRSLEKKTPVEIWMTEEGAKAWSVFGYSAGDREAVRLRSEPK